MNPLRRLEGRGRRSALVLGVSVLTAGGVLGAASALSHGSAPVAADAPALLLGGAAPFPPLDDEPLTGVSICERSTTPTQPCWTFPAGRARELARALQAGARAGPRRAATTSCSAVAGTRYLVSLLPPRPAATVIDVSVHPFRDVAQDCSPARVDGAPYSFSAEALQLVGDMYDSTWRTGAAEPTDIATCAAVAITGAGGTARTTGGQTATLYMRLGDDLTVLASGVCEERLRVLPQQTGPPVLVVSTQPDLSGTTPQYVAASVGTVEVRLAYRTCEGLTSAQRTTCVDGLTPVGTLTVTVTS